MRRRRSSSTRFSRPRPDVRREPTQMNMVTDPADARSGGRVVALVPAAGQGTRLGAGLPKAFVTLQGRTLLRLAVDGLLDSGAVDRVVVIVPADRVATVRAELPDEVDVVVGGAERTDSVRAGIAAAGDAEFLLVHDAALLRRAYAATDAVTTDDAGLVERIGARVGTISGEPLAFKITTPLDLALARALTGADTH